MTDGGLSVYVAGSATKGDEVETFTWGFTGRTRYEACESEAVVKAATQASVQLTIHGDHLFYDDLFSETPSVRFDLIAAADGDGDGDITQAELAAVDIRPLANYQVGSTGITNLWGLRRVSRLDARTHRRRGSLRQRARALSVTRAGSCVRCQWRGSDRASSS